VRQSEGVRGRAGERGHPWLACSRTRLHAGNTIFIVYRSLHSIYNEVYYYELAVRHAVIARHVGDRMLAPEALAHTVPPKDNRGGLNIVHAEGGAEPPAEQEPRHVGCDLDAHTHISQHAR